jgi:hypothetical protein
MLVREDMALVNVGLMVFVNALAKALREVEAVLVLVLTGLKALLLTR